MSMHKTPLTELERNGLTQHGLPIGAPSQLSDAFRLGIAWALAQQVEPVAKVFLLTTGGNVGLATGIRWLQDKYGCDFNLPPGTLLYAGAAPAAQPTCKQDLPVETTQERYVRMCPDSECGRKKQCTRIVGVSCMSRADIAPAAQPDARKVIEELLTDARHLARIANVDHGERAAIQAGQQWLEKNK